MNSIKQDQSNGIIPSSLKLTDALATKLLFYIEVELSLDDNMATISIQRFGVSNLRIPGRRASIWHDLKLF